MAGTVPIVSRASVAAPKDYTVPQAQEIIPRAVTAAIDGSGIATSWQPTLQLLANDGTVLWTATAETLAAGVSADVSWFPGVVAETFVPTPGTGVPPAGNLDGYLFKKSNVTATGTGHSSRASLLIQGDTITLDGATSILVEFGCSWVEINTGAVNQAAEVELWDHFNGSDVDKGTVGVFEYFGTDTAGSSMYCAIGLTPAAGQHTYSLYGWKNVAASTVTFVANTLLDGTGNVAPMWYRIVVIPFDNTLPS